MLGPRDRFAVARSAAALCAVFAVCVAAPACSGDEPVADAGSDDAGVTALPDGATVLPDGAVVGEDGSVIVEFEAGTDTDGATPGDGGEAGADASTPVPCATASINGGATLRCFANVSSTTNAGAFPTGAYVLNRWWNGGSCYAIGTGELFEANRAQYFRYAYAIRADVNAPPVPVTGTWRLDVVNGKLVRTEVCDPARLGRAVSGEFQANAAGFVANDGSPAVLQQGWAKQ